ncbi:MetQ/NlpA family ABC transporter substrate-binding protein, partial [Escherichia coli]|nr:MetQ/NlpA family ABC transporter substrate-binding protein [Escherichia coli]
MLHPVFSARFSAGRAARVLMAALLGVALLNGA